MVEADVGVDSLANLGKKGGIGREWPLKLYLVTQLSF